MRFNYSKLLGRMKECGYTQEKMAQEIGLSKATMSLKLNNKAYFYHPELQKICELLNITGADVYAIFFTPEVEKSSTTEEE